MSSNPPPDPLPPLDAKEQALAERLQAHPPRVSPSLRRRVRDRIQLAFSRRALRRRATVLVSSGTVLLVLACVLALSAPR